MENWSVATTCSDEAEEGMFTCEQCAATLPTQRALDDHLHGFKHKKKVREQEKLWLAMRKTEEPYASSRQATVHEEE